MLRDLRYQLWGLQKEAILEEAKAITRLPADVVEWRIDWFENVFDFAALEDVMKDLRQVLGDLPLLMTFRTSKEGGESHLEDEVYADINIKRDRQVMDATVRWRFFTGMKSSEDHRGRRTCRRREGCGVQPRFLQNTGEG